MAKNFGHAGAIDRWLRSCDATKKAVLFTDFVWEKNVCWFLPLFISKIPESCILIDSNVQIPQSCCKYYDYKGRNCHGFNPIEDVLLATNGWLILCIGAKIRSLLIQFLSPFGDLSKKLHLLSASERMLCQRLIQRFTVPTRLYYSASITIAVAN